MEIIYIDGYWIDSKEEIKNYKCVLGGEWNGKEDDFDQSIFFYFADEGELDEYKETEADGRKDSEFVVTAVRR